MFLWNLFGSIILKNKESDAPRELWINRWLRDCGLCVITLNSYSFWLCNSRSTQTLANESSWTSHTHSLTVFINKIVSLTTKVSNYPKFYWITKRQCKQTDSPIALSAFDLWPGFFFVLPSFVLFLSLSLSIQARVKS